MRVTAQLRQFVYAGKVSTEKGEKIAGASAITLHSFGPEGGGEDFDLDCKELVQGWR